MHVCLFLILETNICIILSQIEPNFNQQIVY
jgi:hypothetical protein